MCHTTTLRRCLIADPVHGVLAGRGHKQRRWHRRRHGCWQRFLPGRQHVPPLLDGAAHAPAEPSASAAAAAAAAAPADVRGPGRADHVGRVRPNRRHRVAGRAGEAERDAGRDAADQRLPAAARCQAVPVHTRCC